ncbi:MAG: hypothetical protein HKN00_07660 [Flavobacteriaceae bacterium]|nr:hypothetical protein [Bacteroidia bacterium]NNF75042.1 hypothetical protein [Flavobacteriaceae bacterium]NNK73989.1 hypothetical protein [Flavobacteriaceae bacterium]NNL80010.1 hypothetical protein [Flavobacteriaceae bacterium]
MNDAFLYFGLVIVLFILVVMNNRRNQNKLRERRRRRFKIDYKDKRKETEQNDENLH